MKNKKEQINTIEDHINFSKPNTKVKNVVIYNPGYYPKPIRPLKDITLPMRLWPDAQYHMIGNFDQKNKKHQKNFDYFKPIFEDRCDYHTSLSDGINLEDSVLFIHHNTFNAFGGIVHPSLLEQYRLTCDFKGQVVVFYNDELLAKYVDFKEYVEGRCSNQNFLVKNEKLIKDLKSVKKKDEWSNVAIMANQNLVHNWIDDHIDVSLGMTKVYLSDRLLYDIDMTKVREKTEFSKSKRGIYVALLTTPRIEVCNKLFANKNDVHLSFRGSKSDDLDPSIAGDGIFIDNKALGSFLNEYDWSIYIGKGKYSKYLGATFYEPLLAGIPVFVWTKTDPDKKIFPGLDCYFSSWEELKETVDSSDLKKLHRSQLKSLGY